MDLIERQAAVGKLKRMATQAYIDKLNGKAETIINCCIDVIERQIPSAQPERKKGKWIPQDHNKTTGYATTLVYYYPKCSECGHTGDFSMNFCPNCGSYNGGDNDDQSK